MRFLLPLLPLLLASPAANALEIPDNLKSFYKKLKSKGQCDDKLASGFYNSEFNDDGDTAYCGDYLDEYGVIYLQSKNGRFSNLDVDCDGDQGDDNDGRCSHGDDTQSRTAVKSVIESYDVGISDLDPYLHSYVVFGNVGGSNDFDPHEYGIYETSVMAVICGDQLFYGVWGDYNGDSDRPSVGETSLSLATACYGKGMSSSDGSGTSHNEEDVLYIAFIGQDAVPGKDGAAWDAGSFNEFHDSITDLGNKLVNRVGNDDIAKKMKGIFEESTVDCSWIDHCKGATCESADDCADDLTCSNGKCAER
ncbi:fungal chitosanase of glycosyl hydrolase group 75-domain-containing protein [Mariannaea sp. PMI_226]|nr:fungal chitosanase of glycosyl hydrolase group 75-domain-containing protein [Mariannaea sp. PMI_226]